MINDPFCPKQKRGPRRAFQIFDFPCALCPESLFLCPVFLIADR
jgi:hypothetical protein